jgi:hypothetical protein
MKNTSPNPAQHDCVSFRLQREVAAELSAKASKAGISPNLLARDLMTAALLRPAEKQSQNLDPVLEELARIRTALSAVNEPYRGSQSLAKEVEQARTTLAAIAREQQEMKAWRQEILQVCKNLSEKDDQQRQLLDTIKGEFAEMRLALSVSDNERNAIESLHADIARIISELVQVRKLRGDLASSVNVLLSNAGKISPDQAKAWVQKVLLDS